MFNPLELPAWQALQGHFSEISPVHMRDLFRDDPKRFDKFSRRFHDVLLDFSKNRITEQPFSLLIDLARQADVPGWAEKMFTGEKINTTENMSKRLGSSRNRSRMWTGEISLKWPCNACQAG